MIKGFIDKGLRYVITFQGALNVAIVIFMGLNLITAQILSAKGLTNETMIQEDKF